MTDDMNKYSYTVLEQAHDTIKNRHLHKGCFDFESELKKVPKTYWNKYFFPAKLNGKTVRVKGFKFDITEHLLCGVAPISGKGQQKQAYLHTDREFATTVTENILGAIRLSELVRKENRKARLKAKSLGLNRE